MFFTSGLACALMVAAVMTEARPHLIQESLTSNQETGKLEPVATRDLQVEESLDSTGFGTDNYLAGNRHINGPSVGGVATPALTRCVGGPDTNGFLGAGVNSQHVALDSGHSVGGLLSGFGKRR